MSEREIHRVQQRSPGVRRRLRARLAAGTAVLAAVSPAYAATPPDPTHLEMLDIAGWPALRPAAVPQTVPPPPLPAWLPLDVAQNTLAQAGTVPGSEIKLETIEIAAPTRPTATIGPPPPAFAGGQVGSGGRVGFLGNKSVFDTPFTQNNYTEQLIRDQQVRTVADVFANDPSVRQVQSPFGVQPNIYNRGILVNARDFAFDGLYGIVNIYRPAIEGIERVEVLNGPGALLYGFSPAGNAGGVVNLVPKRATDDPITRLTAQYLSDSNVGGTFDVGRRFGEGNAVGVRLNGAYRDGDTPLDHQSQQLGVLTAGIDYRGDRLRLSADLGYQHIDADSPSQNLRVLPGFAIPKAPSLTKNIQQPWERSNTDHYFAVGRAEYDLTPDITLFGAIGGASLNNATLATFTTITDSLGSATQQLNYITPYAQVQWSGELGARARFATGPVQHTAAIVATHYDSSQPFGYVFGQSYATNLYAPVVVPRPDVDIDTKMPLNREHDMFDSLAVTDTLSVLNDRVQVIAGGRFQRVQSYDYDRTGLRTDAYDKSEPTPLAALIVKPLDRLSLYVSYAEGFGFGPSAPSTAVNAGALFPPLVTNQIETGAKLDLGNVGATLAFYQIEQPSAFLDPATNVYGVDGEQRNRGIDLNVFGAPVEGVRVLGGITLLDGELTKTAGGTYNGNVAPGVPDVQLNLGGEYDIAYLPGLTASGRVIYTTSQYYDQANTQKIPDWARLDLGARYTFKVEKVRYTARLNVENVTGNAYWASTGQGSLTLGTPRTFRFSLAAEF